jgi:hypothetical protein
MQFRAISNKYDVEGTTGPADNLHRPTTVPISIVRIGQMKPGDLWLFILVDNFNFYLEEALFATPSFYFKTNI